MFELPENISALTVEELDALADAALDALRALDIKEDSPDDVLEQGEQIVEALNTVRTTKADKKESDTQRRSRFDSVRNALAAQEPGDGDPDGDDAPKDPPKEPSKPAEPAGPPSTPQPVGSDSTDPGDGSGGAVTPDAVLTPVTASTSPARRAAANGERPRVPAANQGVVSLLAAADVPGLPLGQPLDGLTAAADAVMRRVRAIPRGTGRATNTNDGGIVHRYGAATIQLDGFGDGLLQAPQSDDYAMVWQAGEESRLPGNSLVAAGGWCAPSETLYGMCQYETVEGILDLPQFGVTRGGIRWTEGPDFSDIYDECGFELTEAQVIADTEKTCCEVSCPPFQELVMDVIGLCVRTPLLTEVAYPELVRRFLEGALVAFAHKRNARIIASMVAAAGTPLVAPDHGTTAANLQNLEITALGMRYRYRMSQTATMEVIAPFWLKTLLRIDLGLRQMPQSVSDAAIDAWFSERNMRVQWVYDWQDLVVTGCEVTVPDTADVLMYPAGTWTEGVAPVINLDAVYDTAGLTHNTYTGLFVEQGIMAVQRCTHTCALTIPLCASGRVGAADLTACMAYPAPPAP